MPCPRPVIGITVNYSCSRERLWLPEAYCRRVEEAGGLPLLLPFTGPEQQEDLLNILDGLVLSGGGDPAPLFFGREPLPGLREVDPRRDDLELRLAREALRRDLPLLGICRGLQLLNVAAGGTLLQDLSGPDRLQHVQGAPRHCPSHTVWVLPGTRLASLLAGPPNSLRGTVLRSPPGPPLSGGEERVGVRGGEGEHLAVNSFHHQGVELVGTGLIVSAVAPDGLPEALESPSHRFILGVQWHPETLDHPAARALFFALAAAAGAKHAN